MFVSNRKLMLVSILALLLIQSCTNKKDCDYIEDYFTQIDKAELEYYKGNFEESRVLFETTFENCTCIRILNSGDHFKYAKTLEALKSDEIYDIVEEAISKGYSLERFMDTVEFKFLTSSNQWASITDTYDSKRQAYLSKINHSLRDSIRQLSKLDQEFRTRKDLPDSLRRRLGVERDLIVQQRLWNLFEQHGYIGFNQIGAGDIDGKQITPNAILLHTPKEDRFEKWIPFLKTEVQKGKCSPRVVGFMIDQYYLYSGEPSKLGLMGDNIEDVKETNYLRKELGLPTYEIQTELKKYRGW